MVGKPATAAETAAMEQKLSLVREAGESTQRETLELRDRIRELEGQLADIQRLLQLRNAELARLQDGRDSTPGAAQPPGETEVARDADLQAALLIFRAPHRSRPNGRLTRRRPKRRRRGWTAHPTPVPSRKKTARRPATRPARRNPRPRQPWPATRPRRMRSTVSRSWSSIPLPVAGLGAAGVLGLGLLGLRRRRRARSISRPTGSSRAPHTGAGDAGADGGAGRGDAATTGEDTVPVPAGASSRRPLDGRRDLYFSTFLIPGEMEADESDVISEVHVHIATVAIARLRHCCKTKIVVPPGRLHVNRLAETYVGARNRAALWIPCCSRSSPPAAIKCIGKQWQALENEVAAGLAGPSHDEAIATTQDKAAPDAA